MNTATTPEFRAELERLMEDIREALATAAKVVGLPGVVPTDTPVVRKVTGGGTGYELAIEQATKNPLASSRYSQAIHKKVILPAAERARSVGQQILDHFGNRCEFFSPFYFEGPITAWVIDKRPTFQKAPVDWLCMRVLVPLGFYYAKLCPNLFEADSSLKARIIEGAFSFLSGDDWTVREVLAVAGLASHVELQAGPISLKPLSDRQMGAWLERPRVPDDLSEGGTWMSHDLCVPTHELSYTYRRPKIRQALSQRELLRFLMALQILGFEPASNEYGEYAEEPVWAVHGRSRFQSTLQRRFVLKAISADDLQEALRLSEKISPNCVYAPETASEIAIHRLQTALRRRSVVDRLLDLVISMEATLLPGISAENFYRFQLNGARFLETDPALRESVAASLKRIYEIRSRLVHGDKMPDREDVAKAASDAHQLACRILRRCLTDKWPTKKDYERLALQ